MTMGLWNSFKKSWRHQITAQIATLCVLIASFTVLSVAALIHQNMHRMLSHWGNEVKVNVYLQEDIGQTDTELLKKYLNENKIFNKVHYLSKNEAAIKFKKRAGQYLPGLLEDMEFDNPLPASFEMVVAGGLNSSAQFNKLYEIVQDLKIKNGVDEVSYGQGWVENYASVLKVFSLTSTAFILILLSGTLFVIGNSIRNSIVLRRDEIEVMELCGATRKMILTPYIFEGALMGLAASALSLAVAYTLFIWQADLFSTELSFWNFSTKLEFLNLSRISLIIFMGTGLGGAGAYLWARQQATGWAAAAASMKR